MIGVANSPVTDAMARAQLVQARVREGRCIECGEKLEGANAACGALTCPSHRKQVAR